MRRSTAEIPNIEFAWDGTRAVLGAGIYERDIPGTCHPEQVNADRLAADPTDVNLEAFVRCSANVLSEQGYFASAALARGERWRGGSIYLFGIDPQMGTQYFSGHPVRLNGVPLPEFGVPGELAEPFVDRDMLGIASAFGETCLTYRAVNPATALSETARVQTKVSFVKSVRARGVPVLVGAGLCLDSPPQPSPPPPAGR